MRKELLIRTNVRFWKEMQYNFTDSLDPLLCFSIYISRIDSTNHIFNGSFHSTALTKDKSKTVIVTDGEFDWEPEWYY
ncbi:MAG TPA: hypothetical protein PLU49_09555 [Saprospiraceae bacterium]|nr:hypothetical protein [Saprospiraceae bacterium]